MGRIRGFSLIEFMAAVGITIPMVILIMQIVPNMLKTNTYSEDATHSTILAGLKMDELRSQIKSAGAGFGFGQSYSQAATAFPSPYADYVYTISDTTGTQKKTLIVTVFHDLDGDLSQDSDEFGIQMHSIVAQK